MARRHATGTFGYAPEMRLRLPAVYEELDHTADVGVLVRGRTAEETIARLVLAFGDLVSGGGPVVEQGEIEIELPGSDHASMAVDVLRELLFRFDTERAIPESCEARAFDPERGAKLSIGVGPYDEQAHAEGIELKAITWHEARFEEQAGGWIAQIVFDI